MSRAVHRRYRIQLAELGALEVNDSTTEFTLYVQDMTQVPVVAGSFTHILDGGTELRPLHVEAIDKDGGLIAMFAEGGRWRALGRLTAVQWQNAADNPDTDPWITYGIGRCSGIDEQEGQGKFRIEISNESWLSRKTEIFTVADTTAIWPSGILGIWRGHSRPAPNGEPEPLFNPASQSIVDTQTIGSHTYYRLRITAGRIVEYEGREVYSGIVSWFKDDVFPQGVAKVPNAPIGGNWKHTRLRLAPLVGSTLNWEIITFGSLFGDPVGFTEDLFFSLENPIIEDEGVDELWIVHVWIRAPDGVSEPAPSSTCWFWAPTAPPSNELPLHPGLSNQFSDGNFLPDGHPWTQDYEYYGFMHVAELTRRFWQLTNQRYNEESLALIEADSSFPLLAPRVFEIPDDPEQLFEEKVWGPLMLMALLDSEGRRKLKDLRPPSEDADLSALPIITNANSNKHQWRISGSELMNQVIYRYLQIYIPGTPYPSYAPGTAIQVRNFDEDPTALDWLITKEKKLDPIDSDNVELIGRRHKEFDVEWLFADPAHESLSSAFQLGLLLASAAGGQPFIGDVVDAHSSLLLQVYQDGPMLGTCEIGASLAETMEEGDYAILDCNSCQIPNAAIESRSGHMLVLFLSMTRYPERAEIEYLAIRPFVPFTCPVLEDEETWWVSPLNENGTTSFRLSGTPGNVSVSLTVRKNADGGQVVNMGVAILEGTTEIASWIESDIQYGEAEDLVPFEYALSSGQLSSISDFTNLYLDISRLGETGGPELDWRRLEILNILN